MKTKGRNEEERLGETGRGWERGRIKRRKKDKQEKIKVTKKKEEKDSANNQPKNISGNSNVMSNCFKSKLSKL